MDLHIPDMSCGGCAKTITRTIQEADPSAQVTCDIPARTVRVETGADGAVLLARLKDAGYPATPRPA